MKKLNIIKLLINTTFILFIVVVVNRIFKYPIAMIREKGAPYGFDFSREENTWVAKIFASTEIILILLFVLAIYFLKSTVKYFVDKNYFAQKVSKHFIRAGYLFIFLGVSNFIFKKLIGVFLDFGYALTIMQGSDGNDIFMIFIGSFFVFISKAFFQAKEIQQENDLTI
jgi:Protein of unknown function (DUF2975)